MDEALREINNLRDILVRRTAELDRREDELLRENNRLHETVATLRREKSDLKVELKACENTVEAKTQTILKLKRQLTIEKSRQERKENIPVEKMEPVHIKESRMIEKDDSFEELGLLTAKILSEAINSTSDKSRACDWLIRLARRISLYWRHAPTNKTQIEASFDLTSQLLEFHWENPNEHSKTALAQIACNIYQLKVDSLLFVKHLILCLKFLPISPRGANNLIPMIKRLDASQLTSGMNLLRASIGAINSTETRFGLQSLCSYIVKFTEIASERSLVDKLGGLIYELVRGFGLLDWKKLDRQESSKFASKIYEKRRSLTFDTKACLIL